ncbi:MAG TPA: hypothetical protein VGR06_02390 [Actinophytocola sp.]|jgi:hypothetical protein|nr:hypothetical protein [Actinophytocola sp.]
MAASTSGGVWPGLECGRLDAHALAAAVGDWLVARDRHDHPAPAQRPRQRAVAIDGKTLRLRHEVARGGWLRWRRFDVMSKT